MPVTAHGRAVIEDYVHAANLDGQAEMFDAQLLAFLEETG